MLKRLLAAFALVLSSFLAQGQSVKDLKPVADSLAVLLQERTSVHSTLTVTRVQKRGDLTDVYFKNTLGDYPWREKDVTWFHDKMESLVQTSFPSFKIGNIICVRYPLSFYATPELENSGKPSAYKYSYANPGDRRFVKRLGAKEFSKGLTGRNIVLWQSHGKYYEAKNHRWQFQRAPVHRTVEDVYTQSYVLPFLIPMLENAGAYVMTPRERDTQLQEYIIDNDPSFAGERNGLVRRSGSYKENGRWESAGEGFADKKLHYLMEDNPFVMGSARQAEAAANPSARWTPDIMERGEYAVYVSYKTVENSTNDARYTVHHLGGDTKFSVDQTKGGGTWIYLGTFTFDKGKSGYVTLEASGSKGVVTADAVKIGGGIGKYERDGHVSGAPSYVEGALYWEKWAGADEKLLEDWESDYTKDYAGRGAWASMMQKEKGIQYDLSFAFHSDAGVTPNDSIVGTLAIYTLRNEGKETLPDGHSRQSARSFADLVQTQVVNDIREDFDPEWTRRETWDKSYSESRTTSVPGMLLELLSHQNLADMKHGLDPAFRFTVSRAVYKGMLKFLSNLYGTPYVVQPLPVQAFSAHLNGTKVELKWKETPDSKESTATPDGYMVYTRIDGGVFDSGKEVKGTELSLSIEPGHIYSYKVMAYNAGGYSFPSEILSVGTPSQNAKKVLVVNNFYRVSAPSWVDTPSYAGFTGQQDSGVPYISDLTYIGENYEFDRNAPWVEDDNAGWGASFIENAGEKIAGNTFDFPYVHGKAIMDAGYAFASSSADAWCDNSELSKAYSAIDIICGKQVTTQIGRGAVPSRYTVFTDDVKKALKNYADNGGKILISGAKIGTEAETDDNTKKFVNEVLGYRFLTSHASRAGKVESFSDSAFRMRGLPESFQISNTLNPDIYCVENPDGILPSNSKSSTVLRYTGSNISAATCYDSGKHKAISFGFPIEAVIDPAVRSTLIKDALNYLCVQ